MTEFAVKAALLEAAPLLASDLTVKAALLASALAANDWK